MWDSSGLAEYQLRSGSFSEDSRGRWYAGFEGVGWVGLLAPRQTPHALVNKIAAEIQAVLAQPAVLAKINENGAVVDARGPAEWSAFVRKELDVWRTAVTQSGIKID